MNTAEALAELGVTDADFTVEQRRQFEEQGYFIVPDYFSREEVEQLRAEFDRFESEKVVHEDLRIEPGGEFLVDLFNKSAVFDLCLRSKPTLAAAHDLMGEIRVYSLNGRNPAKGKGHQGLHSDVPRAHADDWRVVNTMIMLDDMSEDNGATRLVPGTHRKPALNVPDDNVGGEPAVALTPEEMAEIPADPTATHPDEIRVVGKAGSICVINGHIWHGGTLNRSGRSRRLLHLAVGRRDVPPQLDQRSHLTPALKKRATPAQQYLLDIEDAEPVVEDHVPA
jgi:ectoine hydroxylase-related dioxygenase (phytanoyl-CoA dioxygenase family)